MTKRNHAAWAALFLAPSAIPLVLFVLLPMISSIRISLLSWNLISAPKFVGLGNYVNLLASPTTARRARACSRTTPTTRST